ncbi:MAG: type II toxin-antitoxin system RelE/ParE family toxin [Ignavibacteriae bacterium]|nr:type II toxin-antitoxin system RelE/ParE family toxin [Ignavibacteriota bacterium]
MVRISWTIESKKDLQQIYEYIAKDSPRYAQKQIEKILLSVKPLKQFPLLGRKVPEFPELPYRELLTGNYRVIYRFDENNNVNLIMGVIHVKRLLTDIP